MSGAGTRSLEGPVKVLLKRLDGVLERRASKGMKRSLMPQEPGAFDFSSNDYLGLARSAELQRLVQKELARVNTINEEKGLNFIGATGSRLLAGNTWYHTSVENWMANFFQRDSALLFNSGYDLNLGLMSCLPTEGDTVIYDEYVHNSTIMGLRSARRPANRPFRHNCVRDLRAQLEAVRSSGRGAGGAVLVVVEAVYSMEGDVAPLSRICDLAHEYDACVVVDEAHSTGLLGPSGKGLVCQEGLERHPALLAAVHTFGKAVGCHGAVLCGPQSLKEYMINYCFPFIYSTALSFHSVATARVACEYQGICENRRDGVRSLIAAFRGALQAQLPAVGSQSQGACLLPSDTPIQALVVPGNEQVVALATSLQARGYDVRPLRSPTVPVGMERLRIILHHHNTVDEVHGLTSAIIELLGSETGTRQARL